MTMTMNDNECRKGPKVHMLHVEIRSDNVGHWPIIATVHGRCKYQKCSTLSYVKCEKCNVSLCLNKDRNCFRQIMIELYYFIEKFILFENKKLYARMSFFSAGKLQNISKNNSSRTLHSQIYVYFWIIA